MPRPASPHRTILPTANQWDWTAPPISPVIGSWAMIEKVWAKGLLFLSGGNGRGCSAMFASMQVDLQINCASLLVAGLPAAKDQEREYHAGDHGGRDEQGL